MRPGGWRTGRAGWPHRPLDEGAVVGLPRALLFYELYPFWRAFFEGLGLKVLVSGPTVREVVETGVRHAIDEVCLPVKAFYGHVVALRDKVDAVFLPRLVSLRGGTYTCPKLLGLPDMVRQNVERLGRVVAVDVDETCHGQGLADAAEKLGYGLVPGDGRERVRRAVAAGLEALTEFRRGLWAGRSFEEAATVAVAATRAPGAAGLEAAGADAAGAVDDRPANWRPAAASGRPDGRPRVGLAGHPYLLFDRGLNLGLARKLEALGCEVLTSEMLSEDEVAAESSRLPKQIFWSSGRRVLAGVTRFRRDRLVDGVIHLVSFGCGPDSMIGEIAERETRRESDLPYMALTLDEHTAEAGLVTRLEAFVEMLARRRGRTA